MWFGHDPLGRCVKRWIAPSAGSTGYNPATYYYYEGWSLIQEGSSSSASNAARLYVHGGRMDEIVAQITPGNGWQRYFQYDARGHCTLQTDAFGDIVEQYDYDAFGFPYFYDRWGNNMPSSPWGNRFLFTGREWMSDLRTYDYRNRMYQPELGRFLQPDPKQFEAGDYNLYRYCRNDPINRNDPWGLEAVKLLLEKSGNWGDKTAKDYYKDSVTANNKPAEGVTKAELQKLTPNDDGSVSVHLFVDTHVKAAHKDGKVDNKEQEHPNGWKDFAKTLQDRVFMRFKDQTHSSPSEAAKAQADYIQKLYKDEKTRQLIWDRPGGPHDYSRPENR
jgi:RHS repeat-associated protein